MKTIYVLEHCNYGHFQNTVFFTFGGRMTAHLDALKAKPVLAAFNTKQEALDARAAEEALEVRRKIDDDRKPVYEVEVADNVEMVDKKIKGTDVQRLVRINHPIQYGFDISPARTEDFSNTNRFTF